MRELGDGRFELEAGGIVRATGGLRVLYEEAARLGVPIGQVRDKLLQRHREEMGWTEGEALLLEAHERLAKAAEEVRAGGDQAAIDRYNAALARVRELEAEQDI